MRIFIGVFLPEKVRKEVSEIQNKLKKLELFNGKFAELDNLHLTLKFIGEVDEKKVDEVKKVLKKIKSKSFESSINEAGLFTPSRPRILWLHMSAAEELQKSIDSEMTKMGFVEEERFMSHITIARIKHITPISARKLMDDLKGVISDSKFKVDKFALIESVLTPSGPKYKIIEEFKLG